MKSPFPGMDPYLEQHWGDVHTSFLVYARNQLNAQLPDDLQARVEESVGVAIDDRIARAVYPDVRVSEQQDEQAEATGSSAAAVAVAQPFVLLLEDEPRTERHLEIVELDSGGRVVTAIEVLSPANKVGVEGRAAYARKQQEYLEAGVNLVEIDLIREGDFVLAAPQSRIPSAIRTPYLICSRRGATPGRVELFPVPLRSPLPNIPIPLRPSDDDVVLQLQPLIDACYRDGRYHRIEYRVEPVPRFGEEDARWIDQLLRERGLR
ncbi:MAG: DUF4058 family protein [Pirellulales bacterium]|nr:DUF4058 family protein [Pirellulales bacterium]